MRVRHGYDSSSVVETIATFALRMAASCGTTTFSDELVQWTTTSGLDALSVAAAIAGHAQPEALAQADDVAEVVADLRGIDVDRRRQS